MMHCALIEDNFVNPASPSACLIGKQHDLFIKHIMHQVKTILLMQWQQLDVAIATSMISLLWCVRHQVKTILPIWLHLPQHVLLTTSVTSLIWHMVHQVKTILLMQFQQFHVIITTNMILLIQCVNASSGESATSNVAQKIVTRVTIANINK